jgi:hypothetical protein
VRKKLLGKNFYLLFENLDFDLALCLNFFELFDLQIKIYRNISCINDQEAKQYTLCQPDIQIWMQYP